MSVPTATATSADNEDGSSADTATTTVSGPDGSTVITKAGPDGVTKTVTGSDGSTVITKIGHGNEVGSVTTISRDDEPPSIRPDGMHGFHSWMFLIVLFVAAGLIRTWIRARHGDTRTNRQRRRDERAGIMAPAMMPTREAELLAEENEQLKSQIVRMEERVRVLERIVTDPAKRVSDEIDALR